MKSLAIFSLVLIVAGPVWSQEWRLFKNMTDHDVHAGTHCTALTTVASVVRRGRAQRISGARIEVIAKVDNRGQSQEPFVQVVLDATSQLPEALVLRVQGRNRTFTLDRIFFENERMVFLGKLDERRALIKAIKDMSFLPVEMRTQSKKVADIRFGLTGSFRTIERQFSDCELAFGTSGAL